MAETAGREAVDLEVVHLGKSVRTSDSQRQDLIAAIVGQYAELAGRWPPQGPFGHVKIASK